MTKLHHDPEWLHQKYHDEGLSTESMGELAGVSGRAVRYAMEKYGVPRRTISEAKVVAHHDGPAILEKNGDGYEQWTSAYRHERERVYVHRLLAVARYGFDALDGMVVHHKNECKFDNRPENIELLTREEHYHHHHTN